VKEYIVLKIYGKLKHPRNVRQWNQAFLAKGGDLGIDSDSRVKEQPVEVSIRVVCVISGGVASGEELLHICDHFFLRVPVTGPWK